MVSRELTAPADLPPFVAIPTDSGYTTGYLGVEYGPFETGPVPQAGKPLKIRGLTLGNGVTLADVDRRQDMLKRYDDAFGDFAQRDKVLSGIKAETQPSFFEERLEEIDFVVASG